MMLDTRQKIKRRYGVTAKRRKTFHMLNEKCQQKSETESETANFRTELNLFSTTHFHNEKTLSPDNCPPEKNSTCLLCLNEERLFGSQSETLMPKSNEEQLPKSIRVQQSSVVNLVEAVAEKINELEEHMRKEERKSRILAEEKQKKEEVARAIQERLLREELQLSGESSKTQTDWSSNSPELGTLTLEDEEDSKMYDTWLHRSLNESGNVLHIPVNLLLYCNSIVRSVPVKSYPFVSVTGLMKAGALKFEDRPLWYDVYSAFPPKYEPRFDRLPIKAEVKSIVYPEDIVRARFYQKYGSSKSTIFDLFNEKTKPIAEM
ncbi:unnamed protein product [Soboliphyme baturini]|uniref:Small ribosomal subunit protein mS23 n=1 Tax=Soboliphyme baturini TaxID=241478 RepID=A0A183IWT3_9BILA|nr:unnamed protein product [Soboliphyme baturini]